MMTPGAIEPHRPDTAGRSSLYGEWDMMAHALTAIGDLHSDLYVLRESAGQCVERYLTIQIAIADLECDLAVLKLRNADNPDLCARADAALASRREHAAHEIELALAEWWPGLGDLDMGGH